MKYGYSSLSAFLVSSPLALLLPSVQSAEIPACDTRQLSRLDEDGVHRFLLGDCGGDLGNLFDGTHTLPPFDSNYDDLGKEGDETDNGFRHLDPIIDGGNNDEDDDEGIINNEVFAKCMQYDYIVNLVVLEHLYFFFQATPDAVEAGCDSLLVHTAGGMQKQAFVVPTNSLAGLDEHGYRTEHGVVDFGAYPLHDILSAYDDASPFADGEEDETYDYIYNNCGDLLANFLLNLGHTSNPRETMMIADLGVFVAPDFVASVRESVKGTIRETWSDRDIMYWIVEMRLAPMY